MRRFIKWLALLLALALALALGSCGGRTSITASGPNLESSLFVYLEGGVFLTLDPARAQDDEPMILANCYETLTRYNQDTGNVEPLLATSWRSEGEGERWVFQIREGVRFHDGAPLDAKAVVASLERSMGFENEFIALGEFVAKAEATGDYEVTITLRAARPLDYFLSSLFHCYIVSPGAKTTEWFDSGGCAGTGPYTIAEYRPGERATLVAFADYWRPFDSANFGEVVVSTSQTELEQALQQPDCAVVAAGSPNPQQSAFAAAGLEYESLTQPYARSHFLIFNAAKSPTDNLDFRLALGYAFPYGDAVAHTGELFPENGFIQPGIPGFDEMPRAFEYDLALAQRYMESSGVAPGVTIELRYSSLQMPERPPYLESYRENLSKIGVELVIREEPLWLMELFARPSEAAGQITLVSYCPGVPTPKGCFEMLAYTTERETNGTYVIDEELNLLVLYAAYVAASDLRASLEIYKEIQIYYNEQAWGASLGAQQVEFLYTANIAGLAPQKISYNGMVFFAFDTRTQPQA